jgi:multidrug resistance efflux pump
VDYKSFPGKRSELEAHTEQYYAQLSAYHKALTDAGIDVKDTLVYYPVQGHVRKLLK